ncbi:hypothetical protein Hdeb2414_s0002g00070081 [Helianthus debilis subsp. tardiflorus]
MGAKNTCNKKNKVDVKMVGEDAMIRVQSANTDMPTSKLMSALRKMEAIVHHASMSCVDDVMLQYVVAKIPAGTATEDQIQACLLSRLNK